MATSAATPRKARDQQLRREDLLTAAESLFAQRGYHYTTMEDIAHQAQYGTGTIYLYFKTKEELYEALLERKIGDYVAFVEERVKNAALPLEKVRTLIRAKLAFFDQHKEFFRIYLAEFNTADRTLRRCANNRREDLYEAHQTFVTQTLSEAMAAGVIRQMDAALLAMAVSGMMNPLLSAWIKHRASTTACDLESFILDLLFNGLENNT